MRLEPMPTGVDVSLVEAGNHRTDLWRKALASLDLADPRYGPRLSQAVAVAGRRDARAADADHFVAAVRTVLDVPRPRATHPVGRDAVALAGLRRWLPYTHFEAILRRMTTPGDSPADYR